MARAVILLLDSLGVGATQDAASYGDTGANTLGHILTYCDQAQTVTKRKKVGPLDIPHLTKLGLCNAERMSQGKDLLPVNYPALFGFAAEQSLGKDTPSGHFEICGVPVLFDWGYFPPEAPSFDESLITAFIVESKISGVLGNRHASGTEIIAELGEAHLRTLQPIVYTSGDSVFQIAAHEEAFGLARLYEISKVARRLVDPLKVGRVIARPFLGTPGNFYRTSNRRDYAMPPPQPTLLDDLVNAGGEVIAIGKTADIFAHQGISTEIRTAGNMDTFDATLKALSFAKDQSIIFANFVDFDSTYGHRRDVEGYAAALEAFDARLPELMPLLNENDLVVITADHGCDPTWHGSDHTREHIPILLFGPAITQGKSIGKRSTFADIGQSLAQFLGLPPLKFGTSFLAKTRN